MLADLAEEDLTMRIAHPVESDQPVNHLATETVPVGELRGPYPKRLVQVDKRVIQAEEREPLHG